jgi:LysM repeat protein
MSSAKVLLPLFVCIVTAALLAACGGDGASPNRGSQSLTDPKDVPTTTPWATPPPVVYIEGGAAPTNGGSAGAGSYTVEPNDTAYAIALKFGITVEELAAANDMTVAQIADLSVGQKLKIPQRAQEQQPVTTTTPQTSEPVATSTPAPVTGGEGTYTVQEGDIPVTIAEKFGITVEALMEANDIDDPTSLRIGQVLIIPTPTPEP